VNLFGPQKDETNPQTGSKEQSTSGGARSAKPQVDLFPALLDRKSAPIVAPRANANGPQISMFAPNNFEEALDIVECLRSRASATICLEKMKKADAARLVDFVSGASAAIDGDFKKLSDMVYLYCPANMKIVVPAKLPKPDSYKGTAGALDFLADTSFATKSHLNNLWPKA
jgi:FtsZ-interacting cell division protein YlmF